MRLYFRQARTLNRLLLRYLEQNGPPPAFLQERFFSAARGVTQRRSASGNHFAIRGGLFEVVDQPALSDRPVIFSLFTEAARTGTPLSREAERTIATSFDTSRASGENQVMSWATLREILAADYPGMALRSMQRLGLS